MEPFTYRRADHQPTAEPGRALLAGGTDLLPSMKVGLVTPVEIVDLKHADLDDDVERTESGWRFGALATLARLEDHAALRTAIPAIGDAAASAATRQLRHRATVAGNLLQRSRCGYHRSPDLTCWLGGGTTCFARDGLHEHHATVDTGLCITPQPSDLASVLVALDATIEVRSGGGTTERPITEHLAAPTSERRSLHTLAADEVITAVRVPHGDCPSVYMKAMDRAAWQFALVGIAAALVDDGVRLVASGVAAVPWRLAAAEACLAGTGAGAMTDAQIAAAADAAAEAMDPLPDNRYKVPLLRGLVTQALGQLR